jgi:uncharacterized protein YegJ (DUF2314 family)
MKKGIIIFLFVSLIGLIGCNSSLDVEIRGNDSVISVKSEDQEMNLIIDQARESVSEFLKELNNPNSSGTDFSVKYPFDTDPGSTTSKEHIWLEQIQQIDGKYYGIVINDPFYIKSMKYGDKVEFDINKVSDWKYVEDGFLVGGKSIIYFYDRMSEEEKKDFLDNAGFKIKE